MKLAKIALAGVSLVALATPAAAADGWYLGLGAGWSSMQDLNYKVTTPGGHITFEDSARIIGSAGYKWPSGFRLEIESGWANYSVKGATVPSGAKIATADGHVSVGTFMGNIAYDLPLSPD